MTMAVRSFEVDCPLINGTLEGYYTTYSASSGETQLPSSLVPTSASSSPLFQPDSTTAIQSTASSPTASTFDLLASISSRDSSFMVPSSLPNQIPSSTELQSTSSPSDATGGSGNEVGGNKTEIIILSVVIPVIVIAVVMIGCWWRRWWKPHKQAASGDGTMKDHFVPQPEDRSSVDITDRGTTIRSGGSQSDPRSSIDDFQSLPPHPQPRLSRPDNMNSIPEGIVRDTTEEAEGD